MPVCGCVVKQRRSSRRAGTHAETSEVKASPAASAELLVWLRHWLFGGSPHIIHAHRPLFVTETLHYRPHLVLYSEWHGTSFVSS